VSARDDYPALVREWSGATCHRALDEIDRLRAQVERDRPVIEAFDAACRGDFSRVNALIADRRRRAASAPDEVNEAQT
jgi:hypothetical protein